MATVPAMRHRLSVFILLAVVTASCSSGAEESGVTSTPDSTQPDAPVTTEETPETTTTEEADTDDASNDGDVPEELFAPPGLEETSTSGIMTMMSSSAPYEDVVDHYAELVGGEPRVLSDAPGEREVTMSGDSSGAGPPSFILWVQEDGRRVIVTVSVPESS